MSENEYTDEMLVRIAIESRENAYAPYSNFTVGAACVGASGKAYAGCNVEISSYPVGICAERTAVSGAIARGEKNIMSIAIAGASREAEPDAGLFPCGMCLQFLSEFMEPDGKIIIADGPDKHVAYKLSDLLPGRFSL